MGLVNHYEYIYLGGRIKHLGLFSSNELHRSLGTFGYGYPNPELHTLDRLSRWAFVIYP